VNHSDPAFVREGAEMVLRLDLQDAGELVTKRLMAAKWLLGFSIT
jgi:hypothetical protein